MRVRALVSFAARLGGDTLQIRAGDVLDLPVGADWLSARLVAPVLDAAPETASMQPGAEQAVLPKARRRRA